MSRIHPSSSGSHVLHEVEDSLQVQVSVPLSPKNTTLTVWKRSSMSFQGTDGFTVYDRDGKLAFRVDNYSRNGHARNGWSCSSLGGVGAGGGALILMDGSGNPLLTLKPKIFSIKNQWNGCIYKEDDNGSPKSDKRIFTMRRPSSNMFVFGQTQNKEAQCEAEILFNHDQNIDPDSKTPSRRPDYKIEGSFWNRNCKIRSTISGEVAAKIMRKRTSTSAMISGGTNSSSTSSTMMLSEEVFSLVVMPGFDPQVIMAFVVVLDRICFKPIFTPRMCS